MSDYETPPAKPKPGSLRDRIAAFEQKPSASAPPPLAPRPKPGHVQWKPRVATPPSSPPPTGKGEGSGSDAIKGKFGMSAADAKESIGAGGSLKDRMAALQGKGAFGAPAPPPPRPASEKPKWKPHPIVATLSDDTQEDIIHPKDTHGSTDEATAEALEEEHQHTDSEKPNAEAGDSEPKEVDPEEEERQRRAAIAARIARLGGARVGMAPPVFGIRPPPPIKPKRSTGDDTNPVASPTTTEKAHTEEVETAPDEVKSPTEAEPVRSLEVDTAYSDKGHSLTSILSPSDVQSPLSAMPAPAVPRRTGPPRKKPSRATPGRELPTVPTEGTEAPRVETTEPDAEGAETNASAETEQKPDDEEGKRVEDTTDTNTVQQEETNAAASNNHEDSNTNAELEVPNVPSLKADDDEGKVDDENKDVVPLPGPGDDITHTPTSPVEDADEEEDETARRKRIAERIAKSGGLNPLAGAFPLLPRRQSSDTEPPEHTEESISSPVEHPPKSPVSEQEEDGARRDSTEAYDEKLPSPPPILPHKKHDVALPPIPSESEERPDDQISNEDFLLDAQKFVKKPYHINDGKYKQFMNQARSNTRGRNEEVKCIGDGWNVSSQAGYNQGRHEALDPYAQTFYDHDPGDKTHFGSNHQEDDNDTDIEEGFDDDDDEMRPPRITRPLPPIPVDVDDVHPLNNHVVASSSTPTPPPPPPPPPFTSSPGGSSLKRRATLPVRSPVDVSPPDLPVLWKVGSVSERCKAFESIASSSSPPKRRGSIPAPIRRPPSPPREEDEDALDEDQDGDAAPAQAPAPAPAPAPTLKIGSPPRPQWSFPPPPPVFTEEPEEMDPSEMMHDTATLATLPTIKDEDAASRADVLSTILTIPSETSSTLEVSGLPTPPSQSPGQTPSPSHTPSHTPLHTPSRQSTLPTAPILEEEDSRFPPMSMFPPPPPRVPPSRSVSRKGTRRKHSIDAGSSRNRSKSLLPISILGGVNGKELMDGDVPVASRFNSPERSQSSSPTKGSSVHSSDKHTEQADTPSTKHSTDDEGYSTGTPMRRRTIAERITKLGGMKFGSTLPLSRITQLPSPDEPTKETDNTSETKVKQNGDTAPADGSEDEESRKARISARLVHMGAMKLGILTGVPSLSRPSSEARTPVQRHGKSYTIDALPISAKPSESTLSPPTPPPHPQAPLAPVPVTATASISALALPPALPISQSSSSATEAPSVVESAMLRGEADESDLDDEDGQDATKGKEASESSSPLPPLPPLEPAPLLSASPSTHSRHASSGNESALPSEKPTPPPTGLPSILSVKPFISRTPSIQRRPRMDGVMAASAWRSSGYSEFVMVEESDAHIGDDDDIQFSMLRETDDRESIPLPAPIALPPPPQPRRKLSKSPPSRLSSGLIMPPTPPLKDWDLPPIPSASLGDFGGGFRLDDPDDYPPLTSTSAGPLQESPSLAGDSQLSAEELSSIWSRVGMYMNSIAITLHEKSKRALIGDGTFPGFVKVVLQQVFTAAMPTGDDPASYSYGHLIYLQEALKVRRRVADVMPGDVIMFDNVWFKGHKGLHQAYQHQVGTPGEPVVGIVAEFDVKKSRVKVYQANQRVGAQTVELATYKLEDAKTGSLKVFRVAEA